jgi:hypothetical protein
MPEDPNRVLGGVRARKKDKRPLSFDVQTSPSHLNAALRKKAQAGFFQPKGSYRRQQLNKIRKECRANTREIMSPILREYIADQFRK